jgi:hypothetical protein
MARVVSPSDIRPRPRERSEPPEPDIERAFEPVEIGGGRPKGGTSAPPGEAQAPPASPLPEPPGEALGPAEAPIRPAVEYLDAQPVILPLRYPVKIEGVGVVRQLTICGPTLWDIQDWAAGRLTTNYELMARMVGIDPVALGALRWADVEALAEIVTGMLPEVMREAIAASKAAWVRNAQP